MSSWGKGRNIVQAQGSGGYEERAEPSTPEEWPNDGQEQSWSSAVPWPPQDPAWWADLASQLPAAWGTGAFDSARVKGLEEKLSPNHEVPLGSMGEGFYDAACPGSEAEAFDLPCFGAMLPNAPRANMAGATARRGKQWVVAQERHPDEAVYGEDFMSSESLLGKWVDSQGHSIHVLSTDAYYVRLLATLSKAMQPDKHLALKPVRLGAGWQCGHSILDPSWSTSTQLHWVAGDGRVTVWVRPSKAKKEAKTDEGGPAEKSEAP
mgnify:CR=1 FL=1